MTLLLLLALAATPRVPLDDAGAARLVERASHLRSEGARVGLVSRRLLGAAYVLGPLGEGAGVDPDPLYRWDAFDCVTYVEEVLALSRACSLPEAEQVLQEIRYATGRPAYDARNHVVETEWLPNNARKGFVRDVTARLAGPVARLVPVQRAEPAVLLSPEQLLAHGAEAPDGAVLFVYRRLADRREAWSSHAGLLVQTRRGPRVRHASSAHGKVVEERLERFVARYQRPDAYPLAGFQVLEPLPGPGCR